MKKLLILVILLIIACPLVEAKSYRAARRPSTHYVASKGTTKRVSFKTKKSHNWGGTAKVKRCKKK